MTALSHTQRLTIFSPERSFALTPDALVWRDRRGEGRLAFADIARVRLYRFPNLSGPDQGRVVLKPRRGPKIVVSSVYYRGLGRIEDRGESFAPFAQALLGRIAAVNPAAVIILGPSRLLWGTYLTLLILGGLVLAGALIAFASGAMTLKATPSLAILIAFLPVCWRAVRAGGPRRLTPAELSPTGAA